MYQKEIKNTVVEMNYFQGLTSRLDVVEQRNSELEHMSMETSQTGFSTYFQTALLNGYINSHFHQQGVYVQFLILSLKLGIHT